MNRQNFLTAVEFAAKVITGKTSLPVLECVHLKGDGERVRVTGYNLDTYARRWVESDLEIDCCASARRLKAVLSGWPDDIISISVEANKIILRGENNRRAPVETIDGAEFPEIPEVGGKRFAIPGEAIERVMPSASTEEARYTLNSVFLDAKGMAVATDGRRMHSMKIEAAPECDLIIPAGAAKLLAGESGEMRSKDGRFSATGDGWEIGGKLIDGNYPNWRQVIPRLAPAKKLPDEFPSVIDRAARGMGDVQYPHILITPDAIAAAEDSFHEDLETGLDSVKLNPQNLSEALKAAGDAPTFARGVGEAGDDWRAVGIAGGDFLAILMPIRMN